MPSLFSRLRKAIGGKPAKPAPKPVKKAAPEKAPQRQQSQSDGRAVKPASKPAGKQAKRSPSSGGKAPAKPAPRKKAVAKPQSPKISVSTEVQKQASVMVAEAQAQAQKIVAEAQQEAAKLKSDALVELQKVQTQSGQLRQELANKQADLSRKVGAVEERERLLEGQKKQVETRLNEVETLKTKQSEKLEEISGLKKEEARSQIMEATEKRLADQISRRVQDAEEEIRSQADEKAKEVIADAMQRGATDYVVEYTVSTVKLPDEELKGRIIGREGRNIRAFERATGVEIELDEGNEVLLSSFDSVRREIARRSLEKLVKDRRIRPALIEEVVAKTKNEMDRILVEEGQKLCHQAGVYRLPQELVSLLGRYKFRFSYGQNLAAHTLEVLKIGLAIAQEIKADLNVVRLGCLLHDIGKVVPDEEGSHVELGITIAKKYHLPDGVIACIGEHHEDKPFSTAESRITWVADAISGARPGARYESHEDYVKRMQDIEEAGKGFEGVASVYAYQAGRDVRVMVKPDEIDDAGLIVLAQKIRDELEEKVSYVGQVKVTCIRENRASEVTKGK